jgi:hypothetical protein
MSLADVFEKQLEDVKNLPEDSIHWIGEPPTFKHHLKHGYVDVLGSDIEIKLSDKQLNSVLSVIGEDPRKIFSPERKVSLGIFCVGKGGGKDFLIAIVMDYLITVLLHLKNPQNYLDMSGNLDLLNVALKGKQGERVFFSEFVSRIKSNKFFLRNFILKEKGKKINEPEKPQGAININSDNAEFPHRIRCFSESSKNETWEGYNVVFFVLDEISGFMSETQRENGWKIFETAKTSCVSRSTRNFKGLGFVISYPRKEKDDIIIELYKMSKREPAMFGVFAFSWHFKPSFKFSGKNFTFHNRRFNRYFAPKRKCSSCGAEMFYVDKGYKCSDCDMFQVDEEPVLGINIPIEYKEDFDRNPEGSLTKYCCLPPRATGEWAEYPEKFLSAVDPKQKPMFLTQDYIVTKTVDGEVFNYLAKRIIAVTEEDMDIRKKCHYVAWLDNAEVACDAVLVIARKETIQFLNENGVVITKEICRIVDVIPWSPKPNLPIDLENVEDFLTKEIPRYINLREVGADRYESALLDRKLKNVGIRAHRFNLNNKHYDTAKYHFYSGSVRIFDEEPYCVKDVKPVELTSIEQMLSLQAGDTKPNKVDGVKKDKSDGVVGCINLLMGNDFTTEKKRPNAQKVNILGKPIGVGNIYSGSSYQPVTSPTFTPNETPKKLPMPIGV